MALTPLAAFFTEYSLSKEIFYLICTAYVILCAIIVVVEPFIYIHCDITAERPDFENVNYEYDPCNFVRQPHLLWLTREECNFGRRLVGALVLGGIIGWERREADRPAGIRTMSLVALGACLFTINSAFAFRSGPMSWDASRISAAIPSGVGFLGSALIFKQGAGNANSESSHVVHGLTTAASLWVSAAVGIACGGALYFVASFTVALILVLLRFGPRSQFSDDDDSSQSSTLPLTDSNKSPLKYTDGISKEEEMTPLKNGEQSKLKRKSSKKIPSLY